MPRWRSMRLPTKPSQTPTSTGILPIFLAERHHRGDDVLGGRLAAHVLQQLHDVGRREEVHADDVAGPLGVAGDLVDVQARGVGRQHRARLGDRVELLEDAFLHFHGLEHRLDDDVGVLEVVVGERGRDQRHALVDVLGLHAAALGGVLVVGADGLQAAVERFLLHFEERRPGCRHWRSSWRCRRPWCRRRRCRRVLISRCGVSAGTSSTLAASRSAKK